MYLVYVLTDNENYFVGISKKKIRDVICMIKSLKKRNSNYKACLLKEFYFIPIVDCIDKKDANLEKQQLIKDGFLGLNCVNERNSIRKKREVKYNKSYYEKNKKRILTKMKEKRMKNFIGNN